MCVPRPSDFRAAVADAIRLGGDTDTTGAIVGAVAAAAARLAGILMPRIDGLFEWPRSAAWMTALAALAAREALRFPGGGSPDMTVGGAADAGMNGDPAAAPRRATPLAGPALPKSGRSRRYASHRASVCTDVSIRRAVERLVGAVTTVTDRHGC